MKVLKCSHSLVREALNMFAVTVAIIVLGATVISILSVGLVVLGLHLLVLFVAT